MNQRRYTITTNSPTRRASYASTLLGAKLKAAWIGLVTFGQITVQIRKTKS